VASKIHKALLRCLRAQWSLPENPNLTDPFQDRIYNSEFHHCGAYIAANLFQPPLNEASADFELIQDESLPGRGACISD
jgi:hypothetical protein